MSMSFEVPSLAYQQFFSFFFFFNFSGAEQDAGLDALSSIISRQKQMGQEIGNELDEQNGKNKIHSDSFCLIFM